MTDLRDGTPLPDGTVMVTRKAIFRPRGRKADSDSEEWMFTDEDNKEEEGMTTRQ